MTEKLLIDQTGHIVTLTLNMPELRLQRAAAVGRLLRVAALEDGRIELLLRRELAALLRPTQRVHGL